MNSGNFPKAAPTHRDLGQGMNGVQMILWPTISDSSGARRIAHWGLYACLIVASITSVAAPLILGRGFSLAAVFNGSLFLVISLFIHRMSRFAALLGLLMYAAVIATKFSRTGPPDNPVTVLGALGIFVALLNGIRGTFAYRKFLVSGSPKEQQLRFSNLLAWLKHKLCPPISQIDSARRMAAWAFSGCLFLACATMLILILDFTGRSLIPTGQGWISIVNVAFFSLAAVGIHRMSRAAAVSALLFYLLVCIWKAWYGVDFRDMTVLGFASLPMLAFVIGIQGTFQYQSLIEERHRKSDDQTERYTDGKTPKNGRTSSARPIKTANRLDPL